MAAFWGCASLGATLIPPAVKKIQSKAFGFRRQLTTVNLREGLEEIGYGAFQGCSSLNDIFIPPTVKLIKDEAFFDCS